ncbi:minor tail H domain protein [Escherichia coli DEC10A]|nr:minor tail H domain protein [Escherichia coli DEC10A]
MKPVVVSDRRQKIWPVWTESGKYTAGQLRIMGETSQRWLQTVGDDAGKVEKAFEGIAADPVKALASLNQQYNFLSVSQLRHIDELERTKGKQAAVTEAMSLFADVMNARLEQLDKAATPVEKIWDDVKTWTSDAWAWIGDHTLGALSLITDVVAGTVEQVKLLLVQGDLALAEFIQSAWETTKNVPVLVRCLVNWQKRTAYLLRKQNVMNWR